MSAPEVTGSRQVAESGRRAGAGSRSGQVVISICGVSAAHSELRLLHDFPSRLPPCCDARRTFGSFVPAGPAVLGSAPGGSLRLPKGGWRPCARRSA